MRPGCQRVVAETMKDLMESEGDRIKLTVNVVIISTATESVEMTTTVGHSSVR